MSNYARNSNLKNAAGVHTSKFVKKSDLASLKSNVDNLDIDKLKSVPIDLSEVSNVVKNEVIKKDVYYEFVKKFNTIQTNDICNLVEKSDYNIKIDSIEKKMP